MIQGYARGACQLDHVAAARLVAAIEHSTATGVGGAEEGRRDDERVVAQKWCLSSHVTQFGDA